MRASKFFFFASLAFSFGVLLGSIFYIYPVFFLIFSLILLFTLVFLPDKKQIVLFFILYLIFIGGYFHVKDSMEKIENNKLSPYINQYISATGIVKRQFRLGKNYNDFVVEITQIEQVGGKYHRVILRTSSNLSLYPGQKIKIEGKIYQPKEGGNFNLAGYLAKDGIYGIFYYPKIKKLEEGGTLTIIDHFTSFLFKIKTRVQETILMVFPAPSSFLISTLLLGEKGGLPDHIKEEFERVGVSHILAISGLHITILTSISLSLFLSLGISRRFSLILAILFLGLYLIIINFPASATRAFIMGSTYLLAQFAGRQYSSFRILFFTLAVMLFLNPLLLLFDIGFQLSFLAMIGIVTLSPILAQKIRRLLNLSQLPEIAAMTLSAQLFTFPLLIFHFGTFSLISLLPNLIIVPLLPILMFSALFTIFIALFSPILSLAVAFLPFLLSHLILKTVSFFSQHSLALNFRISPTALFGIYFVIIILVFYLRSRADELFL